MAAITPAAFARRLRRLDEEALAGFVAALHEARGASVEIDGSVVRLDAGDETQRVIRCVPARGPVGRLATATRSVEGADVVVSAREDETVRRAAADAGARYIGPDGLRDLLLYGVAREAAEAICQTHLDRPLTATADNRPARLRAALTVGVVVVMIGAAVVGAVGLWSPGSEQPPITPDSADVDANGAVRSGAGVTNASTTGYPAGLGRKGIVDLEAFVAQHKAVVGNRSHQVLIQARGRVDPVKSRGRRGGLLVSSPIWASFRQRISVERPTVYRSRVTGELAGSDNSSELVYDDYADGEFVYRRYGGNVSPKFARLREDEHVVNDAVGAYLAKYLAAEETRLQRRGDGYRIIAKGAPDGLIQPVSDYVAVADVAESGLVFQLQVTYERPGTPAEMTGDSVTTAANTSVTYGFSLAYSDLDTEQVQRPLWYHRARNATGAGPHPAGLTPNASDPVDAVALAESHSGALKGRSYSWSVFHSGSRGVGLVDHRWKRGRQLALVETARVYAFTAQGVVDVPNASDRQLRFDVYADGRRQYRRFIDPTNGTQTEIYRLRLDARDPFARFAETYIRRYLATTDAEVTVQQTDGEPRYQIVATGDPKRIDKPITIYRARATVTSDGLVQSLSVSYLYEAGYGTTRSHLEFEYDRRGNVSIQRPKWVTDARNESSSR